MLELTIHNMKRNHIIADSDGVENEVPIAARLDMLPRSCDLRRVYWRPHLRRIPDFDKWRGRLDVMLLSSMYHCREARLVLGSSAAWIVA